MNTTVKLDSKLEICCHTFLEMTLADKTEKNALIKIVNRIIDLWTQTTSFSDTGTHRALAYSNLKRPAAQLIKTRMDKTTDDCRHAAKVERFSSAEVGSSCPQPPLLLVSSNKSECYKYCR